MTGVDRAVTVVERAVTQLLQKGDWQKAAIVHS